MTGTLQLGLQVELFLPRNAVLMAPRYAPALAICNGKLTANSACLGHFGSNLQGVLDARG